MPQLPRLTKCRKYIWNDAQTVRNATFVGTGLLNLMMGTCLDIVNGRLADLLIMLKERNLYKQGVKYRFNAVRSAYATVWNVINLDAESSRGGKQVYFDYLDTAVEKAEPHVLKLYYPVKQVLDRHRIPNSELVAHCETIRLLLALALRSFNMVCRLVDEEARCQASYLYAELSPEGIIKSFDTFHALLFPNYNIPVMEHHIANDDNVALAMKILNEKINNLANVAESAKYARDLNGIADDE